MPNSIACKFLQYDFTAKVHYMQIPRQPIYCQNPLLADSITCKFTHPLMTNSNRKLHNYIGFQLAPKSITLDDLELDCGRPPLFSNTYTNITPAVCNIETLCLVLGWGFHLSLDFFTRSLLPRTCTAVAHLLLHQL